ncbi:glucose dehydrogenase [FAD, quinone]-like [Oratosquilla oratoria]|uniref:glucose dehydrogenase [FAD, quinone]-like n=1 Tax=Oratosquilla oratoria TaxID=337810 RepID=UPI003F76CD69
MGFLQRGKEDANFFTVPQKYSHFGFENKRAPYPRGRVVGGTSVINHMLYLRGNRRDYDRWAAAGNDGWDFQSLLHYFKKSEDFRGTRTKESDEYHGQGGPLRVESKRWGTSVGPRVLEAGKELGYDIVDSNGPSQIGFGVPDITAVNGIRGAVDKVYLQPALKRQNLHVSIKSRATKIMFDENGQATGVQYIRDGKTKFAFAKREVIISAGAIESPQLLMLSGVGPSDHLHQHGIPVVVDLPGVGQNLQDHPILLGLSWTSRPASALNLLTFLRPSAAKDFIHQRQGPLTSPLAFEAMAWPRLNPDDPEWPDIQVLFTSATPAIDKGILFRRILGLDEEVFRDYFGPLYGREGITMAPLLTRPLSRGSVTLSSKNPFAPPFIDPNYLSHPQDVATIVKGVRFALEVGNTRAMKNFGVQFHDKVLSGCKNYTLGSDDYWGCFARHMATTGYHPAGTCKMAGPRDPMGVVSPRLRVRGVKGLRVADASIMPHITTSSLNAPCVMIGEKAADMIKEDWGALR